jgi:hypothetical protein
MFLDYLWGGMMDVLYLLWQIIGITFVVWILTIAVFSIGGALAYVIKNKFYGD